MATVQARRRQALRLLQLSRQRQQKPDAQCRSGYRHITLRGGRRRLVHRLVMEALLGRRLRTSEHVHHRDGNGYNNHPRNLELLSDAQHKSLTHRIYPLLAYCQYCGGPFLPRTFGTPNGTVLTRHCSLSCAARDRRPRLPRRTPHPNRNPPLARQ